MDQIPKVAGRQPNRKLVIEYVSADQLTLDPRNPRRHPKSQIATFARSIDAFDQCVPIGVNAELQVIAGEAILLACRQLGRPTVAIVRLDHLNPAQQRAYQVASNRIAELSSWDDTRLAEILRDLSVELDLDIELTGFAAADAEFRVQSLETITEADEEDVPEPDPTRQVTQLGDLWVFPRGHRLLCGDALEAGSYALLMDGQKAALALTDPPYGQSIDSYVGLGQIKHREFIMGSEGMSPDELREFLGTTCAHLAAHLRPGALAFVFMDWRGLASLLTVGLHQFGELKNLAIWVKDVPGMGSFYRSQHEICAIFKSGKGRHRNNVQLGRFGRNRSNVWHYAGMGGLGRRTEEGDLLAMHPTVKPIAMIADAILDCTVRREIVLDPFLGSGTGMLAAERTGRRCYAMELDPLYVDLAIRRLRRIIGEEPTCATTGKTFSHIAAERGVSDE